ncbi:MAG: L,D-transpeptidase family protein [Bacteroidales bacterium]|nr:L,D-transpeptidase family protein [Bacteroidales bacterium]
MNGKIRICYSLYAHLGHREVNKGDVVRKREIIGDIGTGEGQFPAHLHLEIRKESMADKKSTFWPSSESKDLTWVKKHYEDPVSFISNFRKLTVPYNEANIIIADKSDYKLYYYKQGCILKEYEIALSQNPLGHKEREGDLKMPEGEYYICEKQKGPFYGSFGEFLGPCLLRISYPNIFDAVSGFKNGLINEDERDKILKANQSLSIPPKNSLLGGGIVIHGWKGDWTANGRQNLTWGCISMHNHELVDFYNLVKIGTKIIIIP